LPKISLKVPLDRVNLFLCGTFGYR